QSPWSARLIGAATEPHSGHAFNPCSLWTRLSGDHSGKRADAVPGFDVDDPEIGVEGRSAVEVCTRILAGHGAGGGDLRPETLAGLVECTAHGGPEQANATVEEIDPNVDDAGVRITAPGDDSRQAGSG